LQGAIKKFQKLTLNALTNAGSGDILNAVRVKEGETMRKWLANIRTAAGKSQQAVANAAGISQSYYAGIELGVRGKPLAVPVAKKIAAALGFDWTQFYDDATDTQGNVEKGNKVKEDGAVALVNSQLAPR